MLQAIDPSWEHTLVEIGGIALSVVVPILYSQSRSRKKDRLREDAKHAENKLKFDELLDDLRWMPLHHHREKSGSLSAENIIRKPNGRQP